MTVLKPCPHCGDPWPFVRTEIAEVSYKFANRECRACGVGGPVGEGETYREAEVDADEKSDSVPRRALPTCDTCLWFTPATDERLSICEEPYAPTTNRHVPPDYGCNWHEPKEGDDGEA